MTQEIMNLSNIIHGLADLYYETADEETKDQIAQKMDLLSKKMEEIVKTRFDENAKVYKAAIGKMKQLEEEVVEFQESQSQYVELFKYLTDFVAQLDNLLRSTAVIQGNR